jgi:hypothetical protein
MKARKTLSQGSQFYRLRFEPKKSQIWIKSSNPSTCVVGWGDIKVDQREMRCKDEKWIEVSCTLQLNLQNSEIVKFFWIVKLFFTSLNILMHMRKSCWLCIYYLDLIVVTETKKKLFANYNDVKYSTLLRRK